VDLGIDKAKKSPTFGKLNKGCRPKERVGLRHPDRKYTVPAGDSKISKDLDRRRGQ